MSDSEIIVSEMQHDNRAVDGNAGSIQPVPLPILAPPEAADMDAVAVLDDAEFIRATTITRRYRTTPVRDIRTGVAKSIGLIRGDSGWGTAWAVARRGIATAAHCVFNHETGGWNRNLVFLPQFRNGLSLGVWLITRVYLYREWTEDADHKWDFAVCTVDRALPAEVPPLKFGRGPKGRRPAEWLSLGYPGDPRPRYQFDGSRMWECNGTGIDQRGLLHGMVNNMTRGCSGGPWIYMNRRGIPIVDGVNSFRYRVNRFRLYSPVLDERFGKLYDEVKLLR